MKLLPIPAGEDGLPKSFRVPGVAAVTRCPSFKEGDHKNIFATTVADACAATTLPRPISHVQGTAQAAIEGELTDAVAGVAMGLRAICTSVAAPYLIPLLAW